MAIPILQDLSVTGEIAAASLDISGNVDIDGTTNLDAVDIDGAVQIDGTVAVGAGVMADGTNPNEYITATAAADAAAVFGISLETVANGETGLVYVNVGIGGSPET